MARRTKEEASLTRAKLLDAAELVFLEKGVSSASLNEIALRAGATRGAVYWHFRDKLDLFYAMLERVTLPMEHAAYSCEPESTPLEGLECVRNMISTVLKQVERDDRTCRVFEILLNKVEYVGELSAIRERNSVAMMRFGKRIEECLRVAQCQQKTCTSIELAGSALALRAMVDGLIRSWLLSRGAFELERLGISALNAYLVGLGFEVDACSNKPGSVKVMRQ